MSFASDTLRQEAARFRRMKFLIADAQTLKAIEDYAQELEQKADAMEAREKGEGDGLKLGE